MNKKPLVTVHIPSYNHEKYIKDAILSVVNQTYGFENIQLIVVDDCSSDNSDNVITELNDLYAFTYIRKEKNMGLTHTLNLVTNMAEGKYRCGCSSDDKMHPEKIENLVNYFEQLSNEVVMVGSDVWLYYDDGSIEERNTKNLILPQESKNQVKDFLQGRLNLPTIGVIYRREMFELIGKLDENSIQEDIQLKYSCLKLGKASFLNEKLTYYRQSVNSLSRLANNCRIQEAHIMFWLQIHAKETDEIKRTIEKKLIRDVFTIYQLNGSKKLIFKGLDLICEDSPYFSISRKLYTYIKYNLSRKLIRIFFRKRLKTIDANI